MAPKAKPSKAEQKEKQKKIEDKTFGLKNKNKSKAVQQFIKQTTQSSVAKDEKQRQKDKEAKEREAREKAEREALFKPVVAQKKPPPGADPKSVICAFFKEGKCTKGSKCKFSHDMSVERKSAKISVYEDQRDKDLYKDQETLEAAINERFKAKGQRCASDIICKHFLDAVEKRQYGWIWVCPNGGDKCQYRHALPPGYKLKSEIDAEKALAVEEEPKIEDIIEEQRAALKVRTPLTFELFCEWRERKKREAAEEEEKKLKDAKEARAKGKQVNNLTGRALFSFDPTLFTDDANAGGNEAEYLQAWKDKRANDEEEGGDGGDSDDNYGRVKAQPLYDLDAQGGPSEEDEGDREDDEACEPCAGEEDAEGGDAEGDGDVEWFCDGCDGDILAGERYDCPVCDDEFCLCVDCYADPSKTHEHQLVKVPRWAPHASSLGTGGATAAKTDGREEVHASTSRAGDDVGPSGAGANLAHVDESLFDADDDDVPDDA